MIPYDACKRIILIGDFYIYTHLKKLLCTKQDVFLISFLHYDNALKNVLVEMKDNVLQENETTIENELGDIKEPSLVINAGCYYIYPANILGNPNLTIINFHNGLLPDYRGMNAASWAIWNCESIAGITWHIVVEAVDAGPILWQDVVQIQEDEKGYELSKRMMQTGISAFEKLWFKWSIGELRPMFQNEIRKPCRYYHIGDIPGNGVIDVRKDTADMAYRLLRATDYGKFPIFPPIKFKDRDGNVYLIKKYRKIQGDNNDPLQGYDLIMHGDSCSLLLNLTPCCTEI